MELATNRQEAQAFLARKWKKECEYRLIKELWAFKDNRIAARHAYPNIATTADSGFAPMAAKLALCDGAA